MPSEAAARGGEPQTAHNQQAAEADPVFLAALQTARELIQRLGNDSRTLALAESCTAGLGADLLARIPGASKVLWGSFVSYTAEAKVAMLGLDPGRLEQYGLVSRETACGMALGALEKSGAGIAASVTGLAGPSGDGSAVPVGAVWIAVARRAVPDTSGGPPKAGIAAVREFRFQGGRNEVRLQAAGAMLAELLKVLTEKI